MVWLNGWAGDNAGSVVGRQPNTALVAVSCTSGDYPQVFDTWDLDGTTWYPYISAECLTPGVMPAIVTNIEKSVDLFMWSLQVTPSNYGGGTPSNVAWKPGVHLFRF